MSGGILGPFIDKEKAGTLSTAELLRVAAPKQSEQLRLLDELERRWLAHYCMPYFDTEH
jgi:hypothetical protein